MTKMTKEWSVEFEAASAVGGRVLGEDLVDEFMGALSEDSAAVAYLPGRYSVRLSVQATDILDAVAEATKRVTMAAEKTGMPTWPFVRVAALSADEHDRELTESHFPALVGVAELADRLGVSRQRASDLAKGSSFPRPITVLASGPVWAEPTITRFVETWTRRPGRPRLS